MLHAAAVFGACDVNMADNETEENTEKFTYIVGETAMDIICGILFILSLIAFVYGVTSWCLIKKFRHFRNYVMLSAITVNTLRLSCYLIFRLAFTHFPLPVEVYIFIFADFVYFSLSFHCWLLVLCYIFYVDFVKVFRLDIHRRYLKSSLFAWGIPFVTTFLYFLIKSLLNPDNYAALFSVEIIEFLLLIPVSMSLVIYVTVIYYLFNEGDSGSWTSSKKWGRFYVSTLIFILSNLIVLAAIIDILSVRILIVDVIGEIGEYLNTIVISIYIMIVKSNRTLWREYVKAK